MSWTLHEGDCLQVMRTLPEASVDCIVTSPPYNKRGFRGGRDTGGRRWAKTGGNIHYATFGDDMPEEQYREWQARILEECARLLKPSGSLFYNHKVRRFGGRAHHPYELVRDSRLAFYQQITWDRAGSCDGNLAYCTPTTELLFWLVKARPKVRKRQAAHTSEVWRIVARPNEDHPAPFPETLARNCVLLTTDKGDAVFDPFAGSGTTMAAAVSEGRFGAGCEVAPAYCDIIRRRMAALGEPLPLEVAR